MKKKKNIKGKRLKPSHLQSEVLHLLKKNPKKQFNPKQIVKLLKIDNNAPAVAKTLDVLVSKKKAISSGGHRYQFNKYATEKKKSSDVTHEGIVDMTRSGAAFITCEDLADDVFVAPRNLNSAQNGDRVLVAINSKQRSGRRAEGYIDKILERATEHFIGTIKISKKFAFVIPDMSNMSVDIFVPLGNTKKAKDGDKVVVKVIEWSEDKTKSPVGKVTEVLGVAGSSDIAMKSILINNGFELGFPEAVIKESEAINLAIPESEIEKRRDMRKVTTFTIDPDTAKDFDDALSIQWLENGHCEIGVHIADVSHYVKPDSALDKEAFDRSTSVYLVDRVLPMLPEKLSNGVCSLRPNEDKLTFSAVFEFDKNDKIVNKWFGKTVTHSDRRFTYEEAQEVIETGEGDFKDEIKAMNRLALIMRKAKFKNGAISFESDEVKFKLDENGKPLYVYAKERKEAHMLIEDFMLLANKEVAKYISQKGKKEDNEIPYVYRIHDSPDPGKLADFALFAKSMGYGFDMSTPKSITNSFNKLAEKARSDGGLKILEPLAIRTMSKAVYSANNIGHYGLAFTHYAH
ncbi:MAG: ribonuclease R family protein, partial [Saprospiraceae bacterium]